jgi:alkylated DNA repair protein (DNA oxidative demethylase)
MTRLRRDFPAGGDLFGASSAGSPEPIQVVPDVVLLRGFAPEAELLAAVERVAAAAPFRHFETPGGGRMSAAMTNCGPLGWVSDRRGYRYSATDPRSGEPWPAMPAAILDVARRAARAAGFGEFAPDACLVNRYEPGARMGAHQDRDEGDLSQPIVSISLGIPAVFEWFGASRSGLSLRIELRGGDVLAWGRSARLGYHAVRKLEPAVHPLAGAVRVNLTLRRAAALGPVPRRAAAGCSSANLPTP